MRLLLDTVTLLWITLDDPRLSLAVRSAFGDPGNEIFLSVVSTWEIAVKYALGKLALPEPPATFIPSRRARYGIRQLPLEEESALWVVRLPRLHADPFDRMLVCQAIVNGMAILTPDPLIQQYAVRTVW